MIKNYIIFICLSILSFQTIGQISTGTYNVGVGKAYSTLTQAIAYVNGGISGGPVTLLLTDGTYPSETFPLVIKTSAGTSASNTLTIKPSSGVSSTITGSSSAAIFKINGAGYVTLSGDNGSQGKNLTIINTSTSNSSVVWLASSSTNGATDNTITNCVITNTSTSTSSSSVVWLASSSTNGAMNNVIKNCVITGNSSTTTFADIFSGGSTVGIGSNATAANSNNTFQNNTISKGQNGIYIIGMSTSALDQNLKILNNTLGSSTGGDGFVLSGITAKYQTNATISNNDIQNLIYNGTSIVSLVDGASNKINVGLYLFNSTNSTIVSNKIHNINISSSGTTLKRCYGISLESPAFNTSSSTANNIVYNNMICEARLSGGTVSSTWAYSGINENGGYNDQFYFNSVRLNGSFATSTSSYAAFSNGNGANITASPLITVKDNIFDVDVAVGASSSNFYGFYDKLATATNNWDYDDYYIQVTTGNSYIGYFNSTSYTSLASWKTATSNETYSQNIKPTFRSLSDLHLTNCTGEDSGLDSKGFSIASVSTDIDGDTRASSPDMGCDEFTLMQIFWTGTTSMVWNTATNWSCGAVPTSTSDVFIPVTSNQPQLSTAVTINSVHIDNGATIDLNNKQLSVNTTLSGTGTLIGSTTSKLVIKGTAGTVYFASPSPKNELQKLTVQSAGTLKLGSGLYLDGGTTGAYGTVTVEGTGLLNSNGFLTLGSTATGTAQVANSAGIITGDVTVERFIPARRAWRFLTVPFSSSLQTINDAWQEGQTNTDPMIICTNNVNLYPGYGTQITYINGDPGYDYNTTSNASIEIYVNNSWTNTYLGGTNVPITSNPGYSLFVRGDRSICLDQGVNATPTQTVLRAKGVLNQVGGTNSVTKTYSGTISDYFLIGNPYASSVDLTHLMDGTRSSTNNGFNSTNFFVWDPVLPGSYGDGAYVTYDYTTGVWSPNSASTPPGSYPSGTGNSPIIQSGQAYIVQTTATTANAQFQESDKASSETNIFGKSLPKNKLKFPVIYTNLIASDNTSLIDGVATVFNESFSPAADLRDASKMWNKGDNISLLRDHKNLSIELRPKPVNIDTLFYKLSLTRGDYGLQISSINFAANSGIKAILVDKYLNLQKSVSLKEGYLYKFTSYGDSNSYANRFMLVLYNGDYSTQISASLKAEDDIKKNILVYSNPVHNSKFTLNVFGVNPGRYNLTLLNGLGEKVIQNVIQVSGNSIQYTMKMDMSLPNGIYLLNIDSGTGPFASTKIILNR